MDTRERLATISLALFSWVDPVNAGYQIADQILKEFEVSPREETVTDLYDRSLKL